MDECCASELPPQTVLPLPPAAESASEHEPSGDELVLPMYSWNEPRRVIRAWRQRQKEVPLAMQSRVGDETTAPALTAAGSATEDSTEEMEAATSKQETALLSYSYEHVFRARNGIVQRSPVSTPHADASTEGH